MMIELLESRRLMSATVSISGGVLSISGATNVFIDEIAPGMVQYQVDGGALTTVGSSTLPITSFNVVGTDAGDVVQAFTSTIGGSITTGNGDDDVTVNSGGGSTITVNTGNGKDNVNATAIGPGTTIIVDGGNGNDIISGSDVAGGNVQVVQSNGGDIVSIT